MLLRAHTAEPLQRGERGKLSEAGAYLREKQDGCGGLGRGWIARPQRCQLVRSRPNRSNWGRRRMSVLESPPWPCVGCVCVCIYVCVFVLRTRKVEAEVGWRDCGEGRGGRRRGGEAMRGTEGEEGRSPPGGPCSCRGTRRDEDVQ